MNTELLPAALLITVVGMGLVFLVILLLWALMEVMVRVLPERAAPPAPVPVQPDTQALALERERRRRAAVAAVAAAVAMEQATPLHLTPELSPWQVASRASAVRSIAGFTRPRTSGPPPKDRPR